MKFVRATFSNGEVREFQYQANKKLVTDMLARPSIKVEYFEKELPKFKFIAWVHPKNGGDDRQVEIEYECSTIEIAEGSLKKYLNRVSDITNDYKLIS